MVGGFPATWDELDVCTCSFPKPGHGPIIWPTFEHHFDTMGPCEIMQWGKTGSQDKISSSVFPLPASKEKMSHRSDHTHALAGPALTWSCLWLPRLWKSLLLCLSVHGVHGYLQELQNGRGWKGPLGIIQSNPSAEAGSPEAGCTGPCPGGFWISPEKETP